MEDFKVTALKVTVSDILVPFSQILGGLQYFMQFLKIINSILFFLFGLMRKTEIFLLGWVYPLKTGWTRRP